MAKWVNYRRKYKAKDKKEYRAQTGRKIYWTEDKSDSNIIKWETATKARLVAYRIVNVNDEYGYGSEEWNEQQDAARKG